MAFALLLTGFLALTSVWAEPGPGEKADPTLESIFPLGGRQGSRFDAVVRGRDLQGAQVVWFDCQELKAQVRSIREIEPETEAPDVSPGKKEEKKPLQEVRLRVEIDPAAHLGAHALHLVTPRGTQGGKEEDSTGTPDAPPGSYDQSEVETRNDVLVYSPPVLEEGIEVTGPVEVVLHVSSSARDTDFTAKLVDVYPDGTAFMVLEGILRARYRNGYAEKAWMKPEAEDAFLG